MATKREKADRNNRIAQWVGLVGSFLLMSASWVRIVVQEPTGIDWVGFVLGAALFFYFLSMTIKEWRMRRARRSDQEPPGKGTRRE